MLHAENTVLESSMWYFYPFEVKKSSSICLLHLARHAAIPKIIFWTFVINETEDL